MRRFATLILILPWLWAGLSHADGEPSPGAKGMAGAAGTFEFKPDDWISGATSWWKDSTALYGSTTVSDTFGDGMMEKVSMIRSGYSSRTLEIRSVPIPEPVPPPRE